MNTDPDIWLAFTRTFGMLFIVLALFVLAFYLFRKFSGMGIKGSGDTLIQVMAVHHLSPKEKLVLVNVAGQAILVGVSPSGMSRLAQLDHCPTPSSPNDESGRGFASTLNRMLNAQTKQGAPSGLSSTKETPNG